MVCVNVLQICVACGQEDHMVEWELWGILKSSANRGTLTNSLELTQKVPLQVSPNSCYTSTGYCLEFVPHRYCFIQRMAEGGDGTG